MIRDACAAWGVDCVESRHWAEGGPGAAELARKVVSLCEAPQPQPRYAYDENSSLWEKIETVARRIYRASGIAAEPAVRAQLAALEAQGHGRLPVCIAKTQYSFTTDAKKLGAPDGHTVPVREVRLSAGAGFVVAICGDILTMPGLPARPNAEGIGIGIDDSGRISGLF